MFKDLKLTETEKHTACWENQHAPVWLCCQPYNGLSMEQLDPALALHRKDINCEGAQA